ncbi:uncharacterized protein LOC132805566 [Hemiscyllium ocellatum]|uniref:uncharacterized protein LOC132805566 n=1 Tax=Hemiscyllium ocellatum TaxID=170820 RepID=UPI0029660E2B|nr:uncharacterized protein LOC132805566 [Hemiscyllium ocellatum]
MTASRPTSRAAQPNIIWRVRMLPLVNSASQVLLTTYSDVKRTNWLTSTLCNVVETSARMATGQVARRAKPFLHLFESQLATVNTFASKRLDKLEEEFPILQLSIDEVSFHLRESWTLTLDNAQERLSEETERLRARSGALVEKTRMVMAGQAAAFLTTRVGQLMVASGDTWVRLMEETLDRYLPDQEDNCAAGDVGVRGFERDIPGEPSLLPRVQRLTHKLNSRLSQRMRLYSQRAEEGTLTDILLLVQLFDRLQASWAVAMLDGSYHWLLRVSVPVTQRLVNLWTVLQARLSEAANLASSAWSLGLSLTGNTISLSLHLLSQFSEMVMLLGLFLINVIYALLFELEEAEGSGSSDGESDDSREGRGRQGVSPWGSDLLSCVSDGDLRKLLEHAGSRRRSLGWEAGPGCAHQPPSRSPSRRAGERGCRRSSDTWMMPPPAEEPASRSGRRRSSADQGPRSGSRAPPVTQSWGNPSTHQHQ